MQEYANHLAYLPLACCHPAGHGGCESALLSVINIGQSSSVNYSLLFKIVLVCVRNPTDVEIQSCKVSLEMDLLFFLSSVDSTFLWQSNVQYVAQIINKINIIQGSSVINYSMFEKCNCNSRWARFLTMKKFLLKYYNPIFCTKICKIVHNKGLCIMCGKTVDVLCQNMTHFET